MKSRHAIVLIVAVLVIGGTALFAAGPGEPAIRANVPFAFHVGNELMPAGEYQVAHINSRDMLLIRGVKNKQVIVVHGLPSGKYADETAKLVFHRYGDTYFLRQVWIPNFNANELFESKAEKEYANRWNRPEPTAVVAVVDK